MQTKSLYIYIYYYCFCFVADRCGYGVKQWSSGFSEFMTLNDLMKPTKHFLHNDTLRVEVKINKISALETLVY